MAAWKRALVMDRYESVRPVYFPTIPILTVSLGFSTLSESLCQTGRSTGGMQLILRQLRIREATYIIANKLDFDRVSRVEYIFRREVSYELVTRCSSINSGTLYKFETS